MSKKSKKEAKISNNHAKDFFQSVLKTGATNIGNQLLAAVDDVNQPSDIVMEKILTALKTGAIATGQEVVRGRLSKLQ
ncbi:hypothetical protein [Paenibacillus sp. HB172176]|uniref:hypothetical protein n=1 Tax=Paenibacillus sp. HB172176 TaxID=2493690 RepID=UPI00143951AC|nr:hypothetical protein [Paenibacillus sp. HB172176]